MRFLEMTFIFTRPIQTLYHSETLDVSDLEHYSMGFPVFTDGTGLGPSIVGAKVTADGVILGASAAANVLQFGPVNLAFPSIHEDVLQTVTETQTGAFFANYNYRPEAIYGTVPLTTHYAQTLRQAISPAPAFGGAPLYPEQYDTVWLLERQKALNKSASAGAGTNQTGPPAANQTNQAVSNQSSSEDRVDEGGIPLNDELVGNSTITGQIKAPDLKPDLAISYFKPENASTDPWDIPIIYPSVYDLAGKDSRVFPDPGIGTFSTNGAGSTGASLTGSPYTGMASVGNETLNKTGNLNDIKSVNASGNFTIVRPS